jgi:hypothetical protein
MAHPPWFLVIALTGACGAYGPRAVDPVSPTYHATVKQAIPTPGTVVREGDVVQFTITAEYYLSESDSGRVVLVPQDDQGRPLHRARAQSSVLVLRGTGVVTVTDSITVPKGIREVQLFTMLAPTRAAVVHGEVVVRYPVRPRR